jgi:hypothetical protein
MILLSVLWGVLDEYWMCLLGQVSLSVLWRVLGVYWMSVFGMVSFECFTAGIGRVLDVFI